LAPGSACLAGRGWRARCQRTSSVEPQFRRALEPQFRRALELAELLETNDVADFVVQTDDRALSDIALEVLRLAGWG
jgi:hypothetical protein